MANDKSFLGKLNNFVLEAFGNERSRAYRIVNDVIVLLTFVSVISIIAASVEEFYLKHQLLFDVSEKVIVGIFTLEYLLNIYAAKRKSDYIFGGWGVIDFLAIIPTYINMVVGIFVPVSVVGHIDLRAIKVLRVLRILRFLRLMRLLRLLKLAKTATSGYEESKLKGRDNTIKMDLQIYFIALFSVVVMFSTLMYYIERGVEGTAFTNIPKAMWWCIVTITTVGYGDMYPTSTLGRIVASATMLSGLALFGLLMNVIGKTMMTSLFGSENLEAVEVSELEQKVKARKK